MFWNQTLLTFNVNYKKEINDLLSDIIFFFDFFSLDLKDTFSQNQIELLVFDLFLSNLFLNLDNKGWKQVIYFGFD